MIHGQDARATSKYWCELERNYARFNHYILGWYSCHTGGGDIVFLFPGKENGVEVLQLFSTVDFHLPDTRSVIEQWSDPHQITRL